MLLHNIKAVFSRFIVVIRKFINNGLKRYSNWVNNVDINFHSQLNKTSLESNTIIRMSLDRIDNRSIDILSKLMSQTGTLKSQLLRIILFKNKNTNDTQSLLMDSKEEDSNGEESKKKENKVKTEKKEKEKSLHIQDDPGPSRVILPGTVQSPKVHRPCISKSEHSIAKLITRQDVANALKLTSLSFGNNIPLHDRSVNPKDIKIPILEKYDNVDKIKINQNVNIAPLSELNMNLHSTLNPVISDIPNTSCVTSNAQTEESEVIKKQNEVIVTNPIVSALAPAPALDPKLSKTGPEKESKKKTSGSISEKSDLGVAQRDSLSSIGSNVCRICMTRGRERLISPCNCKGSLANVHLSCLERWLNQVGRNHCELCGFSYPAIRTPRYTVLQALRLWFGNPRNRSHLQLRTEVADHLRTEVADHLQ